MAKRKVARRSAPTAIVVRQAAAPVRRRRSVARAIVGRVRRRRAGGSGGGGGAKGRIVSDLLGVAAGAAIGWARTNDKLPERIAGVDAPLAIAGAMMLVPFVVKGKVGRAVGDMGAGVGAIAAYRLTMGTKVYVSSGEEDWEDGD